MTTQSAPPSRRLYFTAKQVLAVECQDCGKTIKAGGSYFMRAPRGGYVGTERVCRACFNRDPQGFNVKKATWSPAAEASR